MHIVFGVEVSREFLHRHESMLRELARLAENVSETGVVKVAKSSHSRWQPLGAAFGAPLFLRAGAPGATNEPGPLRVQRSTCKTRPRASYARPRASHAIRWGLPRSPSAFLRDSVLTRNSNRA